MIRIRFFTEASFNSGLGHLIRTLTVVRQFIEDEKFQNSNIKVLVNSKMDIKRFIIGLEKIVSISDSDDIFVDENALQKINDAFESGAKWLIHGFTHTTDGVETHRDCAPKWSSRMLEGDNLLGSPSCTAYLNGTYLGMDDEMKLLIDTELYHRMRMKHGMPSMLDDILIANREHDARMSSGGVDYDATISDSSRTWLVNKAEIDHIYNKHPEFFVTRKYPDET